MTKNTSTTRPGIDRQGSATVCMRLFTLPVSPGAERQGGLKSLIREIRTN